MTVDEDSERFMGRNAGQHCLFYYEILETTNL